MWSTKGGPTMATALLTRRSRIRCRLAELRSDDKVTRNDDGSCPTLAYAALAISMRRGAEGPPGRLMPSPTRRPGLPSSARNPQ